MFTTTDSVRKDKKLGDIPRRTLSYKDVAIAVFEGNDLATRILLYIQTYGYLAEWTRQKYIQGHYVNWTDDMTVSLPKWAGDYELKPQSPRRVMRYRDMTIKIFETEGGRDCGFPYEYHIGHGTGAHLCPTSFSTAACCLYCARQAVDSIIEHESRQ